MPGNLMLAFTLPRLHIKYWKRVLRNFTQARGVDVLPANY